MVADVLGVFCKQEIKAPETVGSANRYVCQEVYWMATGFTGLRRGRGGIHP